MTYLRLSLPAQCSIADGPLHHHFSHTVGPDERSPQMVPYTHTPQALSISYILIIFH